MILAIFKNVVLRFGHGKLAGVNEGSEEEGGIIISFLGDLTYCSVLG